MEFLCSRTVAFLFLEVWQARILLHFSLSFNYQLPIVAVPFIEVMAFLASSYIGHGRWQVNVLQSILYIVGIGLCGYSIFKRQT